jgi:lipoyl(octanoyl) transferase
VGYLIFHLYEKQRRLKEFVYNIEQVFIELLETNFDIHADREKKHRGVWVGNEKITAIGISIHNAVSMHGFAFNVNTNLDHYSWIVPCGITDKGVTSLKKITGRTQDMAKIKKLTASTFRRIFGYDSLKEESYGTYPET